MRVPSKIILKQYTICILLSVALFLVVPGVFDLAPSVHAQALTADELFSGGGTNEDASSFAKEIGLSSSVSLTEMITRLIRTFLGFLGIIAVILMLYAGFLYMTSAGDPKKIDTAKKIIKNAVVGLVIILFSFSIVHFILQKVVEANVGGGQAGGGGAGGGGVGVERQGLFQLSSLNTQCAATIRNVQLQFVFSQDVDPATVNAGISVTKDGVPVDGVFATTGSLVTFTPRAACPEPNAAERCFDPSSNYLVVLLPGVLRSTRDKVLNCTALSPCSYSFITGVGIDGTAPTLSMRSPADEANVYVGTYELLQADTRDDIGVSSVNFYVVDDRSVLFSSGLDRSSARELVQQNGLNTFSSDIARQWNTTGYVANSRYDLWASARDCAGHTGTAERIQVTMRASSCTNEILDADRGETGIDCGGDPANANFCGVCDGEACSNNGQCASGLCENGRCTATTYISEISPGDGAVANLVTVKGAGFGAQPGTVTFLGTSEAADDKVVSAYQCGASVEWSNREVIVQVPVNAVDGPIKITQAGAQPKMDATNDLFGPAIRDFDVNRITRPGICSLNPSSSLSGTPVAVTGLGFGAARGSSTFYFNNFEASAYNAWAPALLNVTVPNADAGQYPAQVFTGDSFCVNPIDGTSDNRVCSSDADCVLRVSEFCGTSWCTETLSYCSASRPCAANSGRCESVRVGSNSRTFTVQPRVNNVAPSITRVDSGWKACRSANLNNNGRVCGSDAECGDNSTCEEAPNWGPIGQYVTIYGTNFGSTRGTVWFKDVANDLRAQGDAQFPPLCETSFWTDTSITIKVPPTYAPQSPNTALNGISHKLFVTRQDNVSSNEVDFVVRKGPMDVVGPSLCQISPTAGPVGTNVTLVGENFGANKGNVRFYNNVNAALDPIIWQPTSISSVGVPAATKSGPVKVLTSTALSSNSLNFTFGDCRVDAGLCQGDGVQNCCADGACRGTCSQDPPPAHVAYRVSTGPIPIAPVVIQRCDADVISPSPALMHSQSANICLNAVITASFGLPRANARPELTAMQPSTLLDGIVVERCDANAATVENCPNNSWVVVEGVKGNDESSVTFDPNEDLLPGGVYRVTLKGGSGANAIRRAGANNTGAPLEQDYVWIFQASSNLARCEVGSVNVSPSEFTANDAGNLAYSAQLLARNDRCVSLSCDRYSLQWESDDPAKANIANPQPAQSVCTNTVTANAETNVGEPVEIDAQVRNVAGLPEDTGLLTIDFLDPTVKSFFPNCQEACVNMMPTIVFSRAMRADTITQNTIEVLKCQDSLCSTAQGELLPVDFNITPTLIEDDVTVTLGFANSTLEANTWYRVILNADQILSASGVALSSSGSNFGDEMNLFYPGKFSWKFKTKVSGVSCALDKVIVQPPLVDLKFVGERQEYSATGRGEPDDCSAIGQPLQGGDLTWNAWTSLDKTPEKRIPSSTDVALMLGGGSISLALNLPSWCSSQCLNIGSDVTAGEPVCGDGRLDYSVPPDAAGSVVAEAEECDTQGDIANGDGCSSRCLKEGMNACAQRDDEDCCGDGVVQPLEQCDDGNSAIGDGCSARCLNEGSASVRSTCGDGRIDHAANRGGEDCDDGNLINGDGCSSNCLYEGAPSFARPYTICGDGQKGVGEDCDDSNFLDGDGCSSQCLNEGRNACGNPAVAPCCGNRFLELGEDCDNADVVNGDGCSSRCLKEGSSAFTSIPTFCRDAQLILSAEECEAVANAQNNPQAVRGYGVAEIKPTASLEVDPQTRYAISKVSASSLSPGGQVKTGEATLRLQCSCQTDTMCGDPNTLGCGLSNCCYQRPAVDSVQPAANNDPNAYCRNTAVSVLFTEEMKEALLGVTDTDNNGTISGQEWNGNIRLKLIQVKNPNNVFVDVVSQPNLFNSCPDTYLKTAYAPGLSGFIQQAWFKIKQIFFSLLGRSAQAGNNDFSCLVPLRFETVTLPDGKQDVFVKFDRALEANATYQLFVRGESNANDAVKEGVQSLQDVGMVGSFNRVFYVGNEICRLDAVEVEDLGKAVSDASPYEGTSPNFFSRKGEEHTFVASPLSYRPGGRREPIQGVNDYAWTWAWASTIADNVAQTNVVSKNANEPANNATSPSTVHFTAQGNSGQETVIATATIQGNAPQPSISGSTEVVALMCENPWPSIPNASPWVPFIESVKNTNFSMFYCRDQGVDGTADDLPAITTPPIISQTPGFLLEAIFNIAGTRDAIGVRVVANPKYLSPEAWFEEQGFIGSASSTELDGYPAVQSGNTMYVAAANRNGNILYPNIYAISFNPDAGEIAKEIFARVLKNFRFNDKMSADNITREVTNVRLCKVGNSYASKGDAFIGCSWDGDCVESCLEGVCSLSGEACATTNDCLLKPQLITFCDAQKDKLRRDMKRLISVREVAKLLSDYGTENGRCSVSKEQACSKDAHCPGTEKCMKTYPTIQDGTFIPSRTISKWPSWSAQLSNAIGKTVPLDPINKFYNACSIDGYESATCWNPSVSQFQCPAKSQVFGYRSVGEEQYEFLAQLEYGSAKWHNQIDTKVCEDGQTLCSVDLADGGSTDCAGIGTWTSAIPPELDQIGKCGRLSARDTAMIKVEYAHPNVGRDALVLDGNSGFYKPNSLCNNSLFGAQGACGDGVISGNEECELGDVSTESCTRIVVGNPIPVPGKGNVACKADCTGFQTWLEATVAGAECEPFACGNGIVEAAEVCDDGDLNGTYGRCGNNCTYGGARGNAFSCGDGYLAGPEECDCGTNLNRASLLAAGNPSWAKANEDNFCAVSNGQYGIKTVNGATRRFKSCSFDCKQSGPSCGDREVNGPEVCDGDVVNYGGKLCSAGAIGSQCNTNADCGVGGVCGETPNSVACAKTVDANNCNLPAGTCAGDNQRTCSKNEDCDAGYEQVRTRVCTAECTWNPAMNGWTECRKAASAFCGNRITEGTEECDDGNLSNNDGCLNTCRKNVCGDDRVNIGVESCDRGARNDVPCAAPYGQSCNYCTRTCQYKTIGGSYCGDGIINGNEFCDGAARRLSCINDSSFEYQGFCRDEASENDQCGENDNGYCLNAGVCNGGDNNGNSCSITQQNCNGAVCVPPVCSPNCLDSCPFEFKTTGLLVQSELQGSPPMESVDLYSYQNVGNNSPDNAVLHIPACSVGTNIYADVNDTKAQRPPMDVVFVTDMSGTMEDAVGGTTRIQVVSEALTEAIEKLYDEYRGKAALRVALIGVTDNMTFYHTGTPRNPPTCPFNITNEGNVNLPCEMLPMHLLEDTTQNRETLRKRLLTYPAEIHYGTPLYQGVKKAIDLLKGEGAPGNKKVVIVMSDGDPSSKAPAADLGGVNCDTEDVVPANPNERATMMRNCVGKVRDLMVDQDNADIVFYSGAITRENTKKNLMAALSDEACDGRGLLDQDSKCEKGHYAFSGTSVSAIRAMYADIIKSILSTKVYTTTSDAGNNFQTSEPSSIFTGSHLELPFPPGFICRPEASIMPIRNTFLGDGTMTYNNFEFTYCPLR